MATGIKFLGDGEWQACNHAHGLAWKLDAAPRLRLLRFGMDAHTMLDEVGHEVGHIALLS